MLLAEVTLTTGQVVAVALALASTIAVLFTWGRTSNRSHIETLKQARTEAIKDKMVAYESLERSSAAIEGAAKEIQSLREELQSWAE